jgi:hypothetical protein
VKEQKMSSIPVSAGYPQFAGQATGGGKYTPEIYSQKCLIKFYLTTVFGEIANTDYEGEIKSQGDNVIIRTVPDVTIRDYVKGQDLTYETPTSAEVELEIDKAKYYAVRIDKIDEVQNDIKMMDKWSDDAGKRMAIAIDTDILSNFYSDAAAANTGNTAGAISGSYVLGTDATPINLHTGATSGQDVNIIDSLMYAESVLSEQNVPEDDQRWIVLPTWACMLLQTSDLRRADSTGQVAASDVLRNGNLGRIGQFTIYRSNNLPMTADGETIIPFGHKTGLSFASQLTDTEVLPHPTSFGTIMRGLQVFGWKVVKPESLGYMVAEKK